MEPNPIDQMRDALQRWEEHEKEESERLAIHNYYGVKAEDFNKMIGEIIADILSNETKTSVLDKHFSKLDQEGRLRVEAYLIARKLASNFGKR